MVGEVYGELRGAAGLLREAGTSMESDGFHQRVMKELTNIFVKSLSIISEFSLSIISVMI